jgi:hypothetical protein
MYIKRLLYLTGKQGIQLNFFFGDMETYKVVFSEKIIFNSKITLL